MKATRAPTSSSVHKTTTTTKKKKKTKEIVMIMGVPLHTITSAAAKSDNNKASITSRDAANNSINNDSLSEPLLPQEPSYAVRRDSGDNDLLVAVPYAVNNEDDGDYKNDRQRTAGLSIIAPSKKSSALPSRNTLLFFALQYSSFGFGALVGFMAMTSTFFADTAYWSFLHGGTSAAAATSAMSAGQRWATWDTAWSVFISLVPFLPLVFLRFVSEFLADLVCDMECFHRQEQQAAPSSLREAFKEALWQMELSFGLGTYFSFAMFLILRDIMAYSSVSDVDGNGNSRQQYRSHAICSYVLLCAVTATFLGVTYLSKRRRSAAAANKKTGRRNKLAPPCGSGKASVAIMIV